MADAPVKTWAEMQKGLGEMEKAEPRREGGTWASEKTEEETRRKVDAFVRRIREATTLEELKRLGFVEITPFVKTMESLRIHKDLGVNLVHTMGKAYQKRLYELEKQGGTSRVDAPVKTWADMQKAYADLLKETTKSK